MQAFLTDLAARGEDESFLIQRAVGGFADADGVTVSGILGQRAGAGIGIGAGIDVLARAADFVAILLLDPRRAIKRARAGDDATDGVVGEAATSFSISAPRRSASTRVLRHYSSRANLTKATNDHGWHMSIERVKLDG